MALESFHHFFDKLWRKVIIFYPTTVESDRIFVSAEGTTPAIRRQILVIKIIIRIRSMKVKNSFTNAFRAKFFLYEFSFKGR